MQAVDEIEPRLHVGGFFDEFQVAKNLCVEAFSGQFYGDSVDGVDVLHGNYAGFGDVAEEGDFLF